MVQLNSLNILYLWNLTRKQRAEAQFQHTALQTGFYYEILNRKLIFAFRGTNANLWDWLINFLHFSIAGRHAGWYAQTLTLYKPMREVMRKEKENFDQIMLTGFSQGAAIAAIVCDQLIKRKAMAPGKIQAVLFGGPRPFRLWYPAQFSGVHFCNGADVVTRVPMILQLYKHAARPWQLQPGRSIKWLIPRIKHHLPSQYSSILKTL